MADLQADALYEGRYEEKGYKQRYGEVYDDNGNEILEIEADALVEEEHDAQRADRSQRGRHHRRECIEITRV